MGEVLIKRGKVISTTGHEEDVVFADIDYGGMFSLSSCKICISSQVLNVKWLRKHESKYHFTIRGDLTCILMLRKNSGLLCRSFAFDFVNTMTIVLKHHAFKRRTIPGQSY